MIDASRMMPALESLDLVPEVDQWVTDSINEDRAVEAVNRRACRYTSSFPVEELTVHFDDRSRLHLILKDLSCDAMLEEARRARPDFLYDAQREIAAYTWILPHAPAGPAKWYGALTNPVHGRYWLLLERVKGPQLTQVGAFSAWKAAAAWIARFHRAVSPLRARQLADRVGALVYDEAYYWRWIKRAQRFADRNAEERRVMADVVRGYGPVVERLTRMPPSLLHGELYPCNVIVGRRGGRRRICPVDWEMVALGPALVDLAALSAGWAEPKQQELARAYLSAAGRGGRRIARLPRDFAIDLDCCRLHLAVRMLGWSDAWQPPVEHANDWLSEAARVSRRLHGSGWPRP
jgi:aminoglycoside phosphotransferase (APT) family kinase protein